MLHLSINLSLVVFDLNSDFVSDSILEVFVFFSTGILWLYTEGCSILIGNLYLKIVLESSKVSCLREFHSTLRRFSIWINFDQLDLWINL